MTAVATPDTREFLGIDFSAISHDEVVSALARVEPETSYFYVVTPNVDHVVRLAGEQERGDPLHLTSVYKNAGLRLCDSRVLSRLASLNGVSLPVVTGSDLTKRIFDSILRAKDSVAVIGGDDSSIEALKSMYPQIRIQHHSPPMGLLANARAMSAAADYAAASGARFIFFAVGSPQQELLAAELAARGSLGGCALCIGASIDFIVGRERRAPRWVQRLGFEWSYRLLKSPRRMWRRYMVEGPRVLPAVWRWRRARGKSLIDSSRIET